MDTRRRLTRRGETNMGGSCTEAAGHAALRREVAGGLLYSHHRANANTSKMLEVMSFAYALIDLLIEKGLLTEAELIERKGKVAERLGRKFRENGMGVIRQDPECDKYVFDRGVEIDCESRVRLCQAACCRLDFALSAQDVEEGILQWDLGRPYMIAKDHEGYCRHLDRCTSRCTIYAHRPASCRGYDCRGDQRIWLDFCRRVVNPQLEQVFQAATPKAARSRRSGAPEGRGNGAE